MARDKKINMVFLVKKSISFFIIVFILYGILNSIFLSKDDESISQAEGKIFFAEINIKKGALKQANEDLSKVEIVSTELMGRKRLWPSFRNRERKITAKLKSLRFAVAEYKNHFESILTKVFESLKFKEYDEAITMLSSSLEADLAENKSIKELIKLTERLKVQDFISAHESAQECIKFVNEDIPISDSVNMDLLQLSTIVKKEKESNWATHERIAADVRQVINRSTNKSEDFKPILKGKALIWDETKKEVEMAYQLLPDNLRASSDDGVVTIFSVIKREHILQGHYSVSHEAGYKEKMTISVVYWPEKVSPGAVVIWGGDPAQLRVVSYSPEYGSSVNIRDWVKLLPQQK